MSPLQTVLTAHHRAGNTGICSVCCSNEFVLCAAMDVASLYDTPLLIEATSNQVDQFGGYTGMTPPQFRDYVYQLAEQHHFAAERIVLGGDHLGPNAWQHLPASIAMVHACDLIAAYVNAGFQKIHLDCSMACADDPMPLSDAIVAERSALLASVAEATAEQAQLPPPLYVIGTEVPIPGGEASLASGIQVTRPAAAAQTLEAHRQAFAARALDGAWARVIALVVQPGVDFDHSQIHHYDPAAAAALSAFLENDKKLVFEAHSTDYQTEQALHTLVRDHFAILKVGPAATFALREAWFGLAAIERALIPVEQRSHLIEVLDRCMAEQPRHWQKHYTGNATEQLLMRQFAFSDRCRYYWGEEPVRQALARLIANIDRNALPLPLLSQFMPEQYEPVLSGELVPTATAMVQHKVQLVLARYARACARNASDAPVASA